MKFNELQLGVEYAIIPAWEYSGKDKKNPSLVKRNEVAKATLVSLDKYEYQVYRSHNPNDPLFTKSQSGARSVGYLVTANFGQQQDIYWLARPQDIVASYSSLESRWSVEEVIQKQREAEELAKRQKEQDERRVLEEQRKRMENSTRETLTHILQDRTMKSYISFDTTRHRVNDEYKELNIVSLDISTFNVLLEKVLEAREAVA